VAPELLDQFSEVLAPYGSDALGMWSAGEIAFLHRMQRTTPESIEESQPFTAENGQYAITADVRLDNRGELLAQLRLRDQPDLPDSQIILAAYQVWGAECPLHLLGDFAFAIWDQAKQQLFCARDAFGVRPFYYYQTKDQFIFGSAIGVILADTRVPRNLNEEKIADFLLELFEDKARTFYQDVFRLPPAHSLLVTRGGEWLSRYWSLDPETELRLPHDADYAEAYREAFVEAVRCRLRSAVTLGSTLSGGLDSSSVTCVAGQYLRQENRTLHTMSVLFDSVPQSDEREFIQTVLDEGQYQAHFLAGDKLNPIADLLRLIPGIAEPYYSPQIFLNRGLWAATAENGIGVLLEGLMGDNVVSHGYPYLHEMARSWRWGALYQTFHALANNHPNPQPTWAYLSRAFWQDGVKANLPSSLIRLSRKVRGRSLDDAVVIPPFINRQFAQRIGLEDRLHSRLAQAKKVRTARQQHALELNDGLIPTAVEFYAAEAARFGIEPRFPFLDRRLVELCLAIPAKQKIKDGYTRQVARVGLAQFLPDKIRLRSSKADISWNFMRGLREDRALLDNILSQASTEAENFLDLPTVRSLAAQILDDKGNKDQVLYVFLITALTAWLNQGNVCDYTGISQPKKGETLSSINLVSTRI
jgi:asparagine synthase (glutamine-hydrolysing)